MAFGLVWLREQIPKRHTIPKEWTLSPKHDSHSSLIVNVIVGGWVGKEGGGPMLSYNEQRNLHLDGK